MLLLFINSQWFNLLRTDVHIELSGYAEMYNKDLLFFQFHVQDVKIVLLYILNTSLSSSHTLAQLHGTSRPWLWHFSYFAWTVWTLMVIIRHKVSIFWVLILNQGQRLNAIATAYTSLTYCMMPLFFFQQPTVHRHLLQNSRGILYFVCYDTLLKVILLTMTI